MNFVSDRAIYVAQVHFGVLVPLVVLTTGVLVTRVYIKTRNGQNLKAGDWFMIAGWCLSIADLAMICIQPAVVMNPAKLTAQSLTLGKKNAYLSIAVWGIAMACIKTSVALTLLYIQQATWFQVCTYSLIAIVWMYGVANVPFVALQCRPLEAVWDFSFLGAAANCMDPSSIKTMSNIGAGISIASDVLLSIAPVSFLWNLKRPLRERIVMACLMGIGLVTTASSIQKQMLVTQFGEPGVDFIANTISIGTWTLVEQFLGIFAGSVPFLRVVMQSCFKRFGLSITSATKTGDYGGSGYRRTADNSSKGVFGSSARRTEEDEIPLEERDKGNGLGEVVRTTTVRVDYSNRTAEDSDDSVWVRQGPTLGTKRN